MTAKITSDNRKLRIHQSVARKIGILIVSGAVQPGSSFGGEIEQAEELQVSRTAYREAMRILGAKGLVESKPKVGTWVTARDRWNLLDPDILDWMFSGQPDENFVRDLFELRGAIEPVAAALAAERRSDDQLKTMRQMLDLMGQHGLGEEEGRQADRDFHRTILAATGNEALLSLASTIGAAVQWTTRFKLRAGPMPRDPLPEHEALYTAIERADPDAARQATIVLLNLALADMAQPPISSSKSAIEGPIFPSETV